MYMYVRQSTLKQLVFENLPMFEFLVLPYMYRIVGIFAGAKFCRVATKYILHM